MVFREPLLGERDEEERGTYQLFPPLVVYPGKVGLPIGFEAEGLVPLISKPVWE
tara:strand:+ start:194 stop:355 length:162 start_codon:yes stop_codon:yes gene_type:complete